MDESRDDDALIGAVEDGLGAEEAVRRRCARSSTLDPLDLVGRNVMVAGLGQGFVVEARRPWLGLFGPFLHTVRFIKSGAEHVLVLNDAHGNGGLNFFVLDDAV